MGIGTDANMRFVVEADNRASAELDRAAQSARDLGLSTTLSGKSAAEAADEYDRLYGPMGRMSEEMRKLEIEARQLNAAFDAQRRARMSRTEAQAYIEDFQRTRQAIASVTSSSTASSGGLGRLRQSFASLAATATGTSPIMDRISTTLGAFAIGNVEMIAILAGISAVGAAWHAMTGGMSDDARYAENAIKRLRNEILKTRDAMGTVTLAAAKADLDKAKQARDEAQSKAAGRDQTPGSFGAMVSAADVAAAQKDVADAQAVYDRALQNQANARARGLADLIRHNRATETERQLALSNLRKDQAEAAKLMGKSDDASMDRRMALDDEISTYMDALFPKSATRSADALARSRFNAMNTDARRVVDDFVRSLPKFKTASEIYDEQQKAGALSGHAIAVGARAEISGENGTGPAGNAILAAENRRRIQAAVGTHAGGLPPDIKARLDAIAKESKTVEEAEQKKRALMKETYAQTMRAAEEFVNVTTSSHNRAVKAVGAAANAVRRLAIGAEAAHAAVESARAFGKVPGALAAQDYSGAALWAASGTQLAAAAALGFRESLGGGGAGSGGAGGYGGGNGPGVFRPDASSHGPGGVTINLITKHPGSPDVVQSIMYQLNRADVLKVPPIEIPPAAGLIAASASGGH